MQADLLKRARRLLTRAEDVEGLSNSEIVEFLRDVVQELVAHSKDARD